MIQIAVCEDLKSDFNEIKALLEFYLNNRRLDCKIVGYETGEAFLDAYQPGKYTLVILDLMLPGISGMDTARAIREQDTDCRLIFTTVTEDYAVDSYRVRAVDYLLKPVDFCLFSEALDRCFPSSMPEDERTVSIIVNQAETTIRALDICFAEIYGNHLLIHTGNSVIQAYLSLTAFELLLPPGVFVRISRSHLVNMHAITEISNDIVFLSGGERLVISRRRKREVQKSFNRFLIEKARRPSCD